MKETTFGEYLLYAIQLQNLTQKEAATLLHISPQALSNYILNKRIPDMKTLTHILQVFHMDANQVFHITDFHSLHVISKNETKLLLAYRKLDDIHQAYALHMIQTMPSNQ